MSTHIYKNTRAQKGDLKSASCIRPTEFPGDFFQDLGAPQAVGIPAGFGSEIRKLTNRAAIFGHLDASCSSACAHVHVPGRGGHTCMEAGRGVTVLTDTRNQKLGTLLLHHNVGVPRRVGLSSLSDKFGFFKFIISRLNVYAGRQGNPDLGARRAPGMIRIWAFPAQEVRKGNGHAVHRIFRG